MRKVVMMLMVALLVCVADYANAVGLCPLYLYGQWNGVYYYYCKPSNNCVNGMSQPGQSVNLVACGPCSPTCTTVRPGSKANEGDKTNKLENRVKQKNPSGSAGQSEDEKSTFKSLSYFADHSADSDTKILVVIDSDDEMRHFRTLHFCAKDQTTGNSYLLHVGQELEGKPVGPVNATIVDSADEYNHKLKFNGIEYTVMTEKTMKKKM